MMLPFWEVPSIPGSGMLLGSWVSVFHFKKKGTLLAIATVCVFNNSPYYIFGGAGMGGWQWIVSDDVALFGNSKCSCF